MQNKTNQRKLGAQGKQLSKILKDLSPDITAKDRVTAKKELAVSYATISQYLLGNVKSTDTATALIKIFRTCIENRNNMLV